MPSHSSPALPWPPQLAHANGVLAAPAFKQQVTAALLQSTLALVVVSQASGPWCIAQDVCRMEFEPSGPYGPTSRGL